MSHTACRGGTPRSMKPETYKQAHVIYVNKLWEPDGWARGQPCQSEDHQIDLSLWGASYGSGRSHFADPKALDMSKERMNGPKLCVLNRFCLRPEAIEDIRCKQNIPSVQAPVAINTRTLHHHLRRSTKPQGQTKCDMEMTEQGCRLHARDLWGLRARTLPPYPE